MAALPEVLEGSVTWVCGSTDIAKELAALGVRPTSIAKEATGALIPQTEGIKLLASPLMPKNMVALVKDVRAKIAQPPAVSDDEVDRFLTDASADAYEIRMGSYTTLYQTTPGSMFLPPPDMRDVQRFVAAMLARASRHGIETDIGDMGAAFEFERDGHRVSLQVQFGGAIEDPGPVLLSGSTLPKKLPHPEDCEIALYDTMLKRPVRARIYRSAEEAIYMLKAHWRWLRKRTRDLQRSEPAFQSGVL